MEGLSCLPQLTILNLASNKIKKIEGLGELKSLKKLVLAFNNIESLAGLVEISGTQYNLEYLDIRNNKVSSLNELNYISGLVKLKELKFQEKNLSNNNKVCENPQYKNFLLEKVGSLLLLDDYLVRQPQEGSHSTNALHDSMSMYPGLKQYLSYLQESTSVSEERSTTTSSHVDSSSDLSPERRERVQFKEISPRYYNNVNKPVNTSKLDRVIQMRKNREKRFHAMLHGESEDMLAESVEPLNTLQPKSNSNPPSKSAREIATETNDSVSSKDSIDYLSDRASGDNYSRSIQTDVVKKYANAAVETSLDSTISQQSTPPPSPRPQLKQPQKESIYSAETDVSTSDSKSISERSDDTETLEEKILIANLKESVLVNLEKVKNLSEELGSAKVYLQQREQDLAHEISRKTKLQKEVEDLKHQLQLQREETMQRQQEMRRVDKMNLNFQDEISFLKQQNTELKHVNETLQNHERKTSEELVELKDTIERLRQELHKAYSEIERMKSMHDSKEHNQSVDHVKQLEDLKQSQKKTVEEYEITIRELTESHKKELSRELEFHKQDVENLKQFHALTLKDNENRIKSMENSFAKQAEDFKNKELEIDKKVDSLLAEKMSAEKRIKEVELENEKQKQITEQMQRKEMQLRTHTTELAELVQKQKLKLEQLILLKHELTQKLKEAAKQHEAEMTTFKEKLQEQSASISKYNNMVQELQNRNDTISKLEETIRELENQKKDLLRELEKKQQQQQNSSSKVEQNLKELQDVIQIKNQIIQDKEDSIAKMKKQLDKLQLDKENLKKDLNQIQDSYQSEEDLVQQLQQDLQDKTAQIQTLEADLANMKDLEDKNKLKRRELREELQIRESAIDELKVVFKQQKEKMKQLKKENEDLENELQRWKDQKQLEKDGHSLTVTKLQNEIDHQKHLVMLEKQRVEQQSISIQRLTQQIENHDKDLKTMLIALEKEKMARSKSEADVQKLQQVFAEVQRNRN